MDKETKGYKELLTAITELAKQQQVFAKQAVAAYMPIVNQIILSESTDTNEIEHTLDSMLDFCFADDMLLLFKKLCRYYYYIDAEATAYYVYAYRDMWDDDYNNKKEENIENKTMENGEL